MCGRIPQTSIELIDLARIAALETTEVTANYIDFESFAPMLDGKHVFGRLDRLRGNLPVAFGWDFADGAAPLREEVEILEAQEVGGHWFPSRARVVWNNGPGRENMVYDFLVVQCSPDDHMTNSDLILQCPAQSVEVIDYIAGRQTLIGPDGTVLSDTPLVASANLSPAAPNSSTRFAGIPALSIVASLTGVAYAISIAIRKKRAERGATLAPAASRRSVPQ